MCLVSDVLYLESEMVEELLLAQKHNDAEELTARNSDIASTWKRGKLPPKEDNEKTYIDYENLYLVIESKGVQSVANKLVA
jgi:hypothetical protein